MLYLRNAFIVAVAAVYSGFVLHSVAAAVVAAAVTLITIHFDVCASITNRNRTNLQFAIVMAALCLCIADIVLGDVSPTLHWVARAYIGSFVGHIVVGVSVFVFGRRAQVTHS